MNMKYLISVITLVSSIVLFVGTVDAQQGSGTQTRTIQVNCNSGDSVQDAIDRTQPWRPLQVHIVGVCNEYVEFARDDVTLLGVDSNAGIVSTTEVGVAVVGGQRIHIEHLTLSGPEAALATEAAYVTLNDVTIEGSNYNGIDAILGSNIRLENSLVRNNALDGILIENGGTLNMSNTKVSDNGRGGVMLNNSSTANINNSEISGNQTGVGINIGDKSVANIDQIEGSTLISGNGTDGINVIMHSSVRVFSTAVISGNGQNGLFLAQDAGAELIGPVKIGGNTSGAAVSCVDDESSIIVQDYTNISQPVFCSGF